MTIFLSPRLDVAVSLPCRLIIQALLPRSIFRFLLVSVFCLFHPNRINSSNTLSTSTLLIPPPHPPHNSNTFFTLLLRNHQIRSNTSIGSISNT
ncbi:hypothetical protein Forpe1208_v001462 [Fusarium oxysporum f. sp. rapae]|uniref:Uncharacterized protein n=1 Tax=Fusarium oxysporum f. sp. rapae TaxID=485398 RepID=A0A8J5PMK2_FUSOX|nr:hypothetical protein Forpe1208_v001462 [Fusarium oxysporum f. sp. rapae]